MIKVHLTNNIQIRSILQFSARKFVDYIKHYSFHVFFEIIIAGIKRFSRRDFRKEKYMWMETYCWSAAFLTLIVSS